ncbi:MAG: S8 family serine peptidase, partial [Microbacteriaceae bacterium]|nr:S8 family serine peptidase [Burkholderiaceae bacterium]
MKRLAALTLFLFSFFLQAHAQPVQGVIVRLKPTVEGAREAPLAARDRMQAVARDAGVAMESDRIVGTRHHLVRLPAPQQGEALDATMRRLRLHPDVTDVEPDVRIKRLAVPSDPGYAFQWHLQSSTAFAAALNMPAAWDLTTGSASSVVAVLDIGVRLGHPDLAGKLLPGYDFVSEVEFANDGNGRDSDPSDPGDWVSAADKRSTLFNSCDIENSSWHGTFIAGQIAAATNNALGIAGINWKGKVLPVRIAGKCGALLSDLLDGMRWAAGLTVAGAPANTTPARILNLSFGGDQPCSAVYQDVVDEITAAGALLVVAAGNESVAPMRPADCNHVLAVGAVQEDGRKTSYSNFGAKVALAAPGGTSSRGIYSTDNQGTTVPGIDTYGAKAGTSFSAPLASAVASLMLAVNPALTPAQLVDRLKASARPHTVVAGAPLCTVSGTVACNCTTATCGAGLLDGPAAVIAAAPGLVPTASIALVNQPVAGSVITLDGSASVASVGNSVTGYQWSQVSGPTVSIVNASSAQASVTLPVAAASFVFRLVVTDSAGRSDDALVSVTSMAPASASGGGGGAMGWAWGAALWLLAGLAWWTRRSRAQL